MANDDIDYNGHRIDERSQIIIQLLRDLDEATAGKLRSEAGLDDTSKVHYRVDNHLGPTAACLVEQVDTKSRSGNQPDEIVYGLTEEGLDFAVAYENDLIDAVAAAEAVETLRRIRATVDGFERRVSEVESSVENMDAWKNRWSTRVGRLENNVEEEIQRLDEEKSDEETLRDTQRTHREEIAELNRRLENFEDRLEGIIRQLNKVTDAFKTRPTVEQVKKLVRKSRENPRQLDIWLANDIADVRDRAGRLLGGRL